MYEYSRITPLRISFDTKQPIGTARNGGLEHLPATPTLGERLGVVIPPMRAGTISTDTLNYDKLRPYQQEDVKKLRGLSYALVANEQRTGKTPTILVHMNATDVKKILIVCPASIAYQWKDEVEKWMGVPAVVMDGVKKKRTKIVESWTDVLIISYDTLKLVERKGKIHGDLPLILKHKDIDAVILDEAHRIKNPKTATAQAIYKLKSKYRYALTGTPAPSKPWDIYGILHFTHPHLFSSLYRWQEYYCQVGEKWIGRGKTVRDVGKVVKKKELAEFLDRIGTNRKRIEVMPWLPPKDYVKIRLPVTEDQERYIRELTEMFETEHIVTQGVLDQLIRIRQVCMSPGLLGLKGTSPKIDWLEQYIKDYDEPMLIFSKSRKFIELISESLDIPHIISGTISKKKKDELKQQFQAGKFDKLLVVVDAAKEGLTLDRATTAIFLDTYPPSGWIQQAEDRFIATTEKNKDKGHKLIQVMMRDTYDERLFELVQEGVDENEVVNDYKKWLERRKDNA